jgi:hypothetical protein
VQLIVFTELSADCKAAGETRKLQATPIMFCNKLGELEIKLHGGEIKKGLLPSAILMLIEDYPTIAI